MAWPHGPARLSRRWLLWGLTCLLVVALLSVLVFLVREYEEAQTLARLERSAASMGMDVRNGLTRSVQNLVALHSVAPTPASWSALAADILTAQREIVHLEWRDPELRVLAARATPYLPGVYAYRPRQDALPDISQACLNAERVSGPAYSNSYFWPLAQGQGIELMEMCLPLNRDGRADGYLVATYAMAALLTEHIPAEARRGQRIAWTEPDGTRLTIVGDLPTGVPVIHVNQLVDLPGATYLLRLEQPRTAGGWLPHVMTVAVGTLALSLLGVLALLARDLRRRQVAEQKLADALAFRKAMEDSLVTGLRARDMEGRITYVNPAFCQMVGWSAEELLGTGVPYPWWPPELADEYGRRQAIRLAGHILPREGYESVYLRRDGTRFPVLIIEAPLLDAQGLQRGYMGAIVDLTEQRQVEELNRASQERLQATARLAMAGEMASLISHELNQPLAAISSYATGSLNLIGPDVEHTAPQATELRTALQRILEQAERAGRVIRSVADLVRRRERQREAVAVPALFEAIMPLLQLQARKLGIAVDVQVAADCPPVWCDRTMVEQVLLNLARNGMQAMPPGEPAAASGLRRLRLSAQPVRTAAVHSTQRWVEFVVADHGRGISDEDAERLFTPFFTTKPEGMGLGLNLCRTVVEQHGGGLRFEAHAPRGTVFRFTLPAADALS